ncbi:unnamed protein product [Prunus brigantina]
MAEEGLEFEYRKKFQGIEFRDMHDLINKADRYASLLKEEMQKRTASKGTFYRNPIGSYAEADSPAEAESDEVEMSSAEVSIDKPFVCKGLIKADNSRTKVPDAKFATRETKAYTFHLTRAEAIFDLLLSEKKFLVSQHQQLRCSTRCHPGRLQAIPSTCHQHGRRPAKGKEPLAQPKPVLCSRCKYEIGQLRLLENKRKAAEPSLPTMKKFGGQHDHRPASRAVFDRLGAQSPSTSAGEDFQTTVQQAKIQTAQVEVSKRQKKMATADEPPSIPIIPPIAKAASIKPPRMWRPRQDGDLRGMATVSVEPKAAALEKTDEGIIDVHHGRDPPFSANDLSFLMEFHKDHSAIDLYSMTPENREIVELALKNAKAERLLITSRSDSAIKAVYQANREARARGMPGYRPDQGRLEDKAPFSRSDLEYLCQYFTMTPADTIFGLTTEERARATLSRRLLNGQGCVSQV